MSDLPNGKALAKCFLVEEENKYTVNQRVCILRPLKDNPTFLYYALNRNKYFLQFDDGVQQTHLLNKVYQYCPIKLPTLLPEQAAIAKVLSDTDDLIENLEKLIAKKRAIKQGVMQQLLTGKRRLPGFEGEWEKKKLSDLFSFRKGTGLSKSAIHESGGVPCILYGELFTTYTEIIEDIKSKTCSSDGLISEVGDVLLPGSTTTTGIDLANASALLVGGVRLGGDIIVMRPYKGISSSFMSYLITHVCKHQIEKLTKGVTIYHLHGSDMRNLSIRIPHSKAEQEAIVSILQDQQREIEILVSLNSKHRAIKQGMMQTLLTGKIRLPLDKYAES